MSVTCRLRFVSALAGCLAVGGSVLWAGRAAQGSTLARSAPGDARLFLELRSASWLWGTPEGSTLSRLVTGLVPTTRPAVQTQPADEQSAWRTLFTEAVGLENSRAADLLFTGAVALAADGWGGLPNAILLAEPRDPAALEAELISRRDPASSGVKVRRYRLARDHELACDGRMVVVGQSTNRTGIYARTIALWSSDQGVSLSEVASFRERMSGLPPQAQMVIYAGAPSRSPEGTAVFGTWWPTGWPSLRSAALGVLISARGITVEMNGQIDAEGLAAASSRSPIPSLLHVPASAVAAWTQPIDYVAQFRRLQAAYPDSAPGLVQSRLGPDLIEEHLLKHLVGDSVVVIGQVKVPPPFAEGVGSEELILPAVALAVETDAPHSVASMLERLAATLLELMGLQSLQGQELPIEFSPLGSAGEGILSIRLGGLVGSQSACPFLRSLEISWAVADRWLVVGTHRELVRVIVEARRGQAERLPPSLIPVPMRPFSASEVTGEMMLVARPRAASAMIDSWFAYVSRHHPEMLEPAWWQRLRQTQLAGSVQLGVLPTTRVWPGRVEVGYTLPNYPAHGRLESGDQILAVDGQPLDTQDPMPSLRQKLAMRDRVDMVTLHILRADQERYIEIPMPAIDSESTALQPVRLLRQAADLMRVFSSASYAVWRPSAELINARLELRFALTPDR